MIELAVISVVDYEVVSVPEVSLSMISISSHWLSPDSKCQPVSKVKKITEGRPSSSAA